MTAPASGIDELIARARQRDPEAAAALVALVEDVIANPGRRVGAAFRLKARGSEPGWRVRRRAKRDNALRALALLYADLPLEQQARLLMQKAARFLAAGWPHDQRRQDGASKERSLLRQIGESGLPIPQLRQMKKILSSSLQTSRPTAQPASGNNAASPKPSPPAKEPQVTFADGGTSGSKGARGVVPKARAEHRLLVQ
jgi:hypothetical protein